MKKNSFQMNDHRCDKIKSLENVGNNYLKIQAFNSIWVLHKFDFANEKWVNDGEAQYPGQLLSIYDIALNYCPFCGILLHNNLSNVERPIEPVIHEFEHKCEKLNDYNHKHTHVGYSFDTDAIWKIIKDSNTWFLAQYAIATSKIVRAGEADKDEPILWHSMNIAFCPFCGQELKA